MLVKRVLILMAACAGIALLTVAVFTLLFGVFSLEANGTSGAAGNVQVGATTLFLLTLLPGLSLYRRAARSLRGNARSAMHAVLSICVSLAAGFVVWSYSAGGLDRSKVALAGGVLLIQGKLDLELLESFKRVMATEPLDIRRVRLRSPGGDVYAGMAIGREIHRRGLDVE